MAARREWKFPISVGELIKLVAVRIEHHEGRLEYYTDEVNRLEEDYRESVKVVSVPSGHLHTHSTTGVGPAHERLTVHGDNEIAEQLERARRKAQEHSEKIDTYTRWESFLTLVPNPSSTVELDIEDAHFFGV